MAIVPRVRVGQTLQGPCAHPGVFGGCFNRDLAIVLPVLVLVLVASSGSKNVIM